MAAIAKSKDGLSNSELDDVIGDNEQWMTLWVVKQLTSLGFIEFKVDLFGGPAKYQLTDRGRTALGVITGKPVPAPAPALAQQPQAKAPPTPPMPPPPPPRTTAPKASA
jgi:hypothetical protein